MPPHCKESNKYNNRCPKTASTQTCIYTTQGMLMCNAKGNEVPDMAMELELNIHQPFYHQIIESVTRPDKLDKYL